MAYASPLLSVFEEERARLLGIGQRMLGSAVEAEAVLQEAWIRLQRSDPDLIENARAWLTTVLSRLAIDRLRSRVAERSDSVEPEILARHADETSSINPEHELLLSESVGIALLVVLDRLRPPERVAFVLHDLFGVSFRDIAAILDCSPASARQLASRARRSVRGVDEDRAAVHDARRTALVNAFFAASRNGDFNALLRVLDADVTLIIDPVLATTDRPFVVRGAEIVAKRARLGAAQQLAARVMLVNGDAGIVVAPAGRVRMVMTFLTNETQITSIEIVAEPQRISAFSLAIIDE
jgi:RNA polymerase sigma factor (sigma-70 family)